MLHELILISPIITVGCYNVFHMLIFQSLTASLPITTMVDMIMCDLYSQCVLSVELKAQYSMNFALFSVC